ncbi:glycosyltransferase family 2 protein [Pseudoprimorskyibacter insulae]|uniref:Glycosyl transferase family 2 n=1 Tax=Pseudoprimorskyibacter insulae TaxID=1695997 RepID=A0A2R8AX31_9RHOB|nr:glycosyltransferase family 2 protein [Pseudoprimorskyibacter insulae]SPF80497.1 hypothetical protein PRI8871_02307 [Pseudoprimorskyibacter insulae]
MRILAVLCVRNEGAFLLDWLAHHRAAGVTDFLVFSNDCSDGTDKILDYLGDQGWLTHVRNDGPYDKRGIQFTALKAAAKMREVKRADWILPLDIDEFVNVHVGDHTLPALIAALPDATAVTLTWRLFGNSGVAQYRDLPMTEQFTRAAPVIMHWPWRSAMFKTLYRNDGVYGGLGVHRPRNPDKARLSDARWFDCMGHELDDSFKTKRIFSNYGRNNYKLAQLNHYPLGAMESYILKADRGRAVHNEHDLGMDYWVERNFNTDEDTSVLALKDQVAAIRSELAGDAQLSHMHARAVEWRRERFDQLMMEEPNRALFGRLVMAPPSRPLSPKAAQFLIRYAHKAHGTFDSP